MVRLVPRAFAATVALLAAGFSPATASADPVLVFPGMEIRQDNHVCTLGYVDPALKIAFTAGHCRGGGAVTSRDYKVIGHLRAFRDNTPSGSTVATHELIADYEAIVLADDVTASNILPSGRALESRPGVVLHPGQAVCHFGVSTGETCGTVEASTTAGSPCPTACSVRRGIRGARSTWPPMAAPRRSSGSSTASGAAFPRRCPGGRRPSRFTRISA